MGSTQKPRLSKKKSLSATKKTPRVADEKKASSPPRLPRARKAEGRIASSAAAARKLSRPAKVQVADLNRTDSLPKEAHSSAAPLPVKRARLNVPRSTFSPYLFYGLGSVLVVSLGLLNLDHYQAQQGMLKLRMASSEPETYLKAPGEVSRAPASVDREPASSTRTRFEQILTEQSAQSVEERVNFWVDHREVAGDVLTLVSSMVTGLIARPTPAGDLVDRISVEDVGEQAVEMPEGLNYLHMIAALVRSVNFEDYQRQVKILGSKEFESATWLDVTGELSASSQIPTLPVPPKHLRNGPSELLPVEELPKILKELHSGMRIDFYRLELRSGGPMRASRSVLGVRNASFGGFLKREAQDWTYFYTETVPRGTLPSQAKLSQFLLDYQMQNDKQVLAGFRVRKIRP